MVQMELNPEIEARLAAGASARGVAVEQYTQELLLEALELHPQPAKKLTPDDIREMLRAIGEGSENLPDLPTSAFSRESFYEGRE